MKACFKFNRKFLRTENGREDHVETVPSLELAESYFTRAN